MLDTLFPIASKKCLGLPLFGPIMEEFTDWPLLRVKPRTIYEMVAQGRIPYRKPPGSNILRFDLDEIIAWTKGANGK